MKGEWLIEISSRATTSSMSSAAKPVAKRIPTPLPKSFPAEDGLVLVDHALKPIAFDRGAVAILSHSNQSGNLETDLFIPKEILDFVVSCKPGVDRSSKTHFHTPMGRYRVRTYHVEVYNGSFSGPLFAIHFEKGSTAEHAVREFAAEYHLTDREQEALIGMLKGLSSKQLAVEMKISPNTVKAHLRLIMVKMGVDTRAGIVAKLF